jgi:N-acetylglucosamine-6-phosphate deacetylase
VHLFTIDFPNSYVGEAIECATFNPAKRVPYFRTLSALLKGYANKCLGIENKKGTLRPGADADLVVLDRQGNVVSTWVKGRQVWGTAA